MGLSNRISEMLIAKAKQQRQPITVNLELLPVCNLNCKMCYIRSSIQEVKKAGGLKSVDEWLGLANQIRKAGTLFLLLTGGEVFIYPEFKKLYIELYKMGFVITINTNATLIDESVIEWLRQYPPKCVSISLYGVSNEVYEKLCGQKGMFSKVDHAIHLLKENKIAMECKTILTPLNCDDYKNCYKYVRDLDIPYEMAAYSFPCTRKQKKEEQIRFSPEEVVQWTFIIEQIMSTKEEHKEEIKKYLRKYEDSKKLPGNIHRGFSCSASNSSCWITWQGYMTPCALLNEPYTLPFEMGFSDAWESLKKRTDDIVLSKKCFYCEKRQVCTVCPASAYAETGDIAGTSQYHCKVTDLFLEQMRQYAKKNNIDIFNGL